MRRTIHIFFFLSLFFQSVVGQTPPLLEEEIPPLDLTFSLEGGFFEEGFDLRLISPEANIYFTLDGTTPSKRSARYDRPIPIRETTVVRAVAYTKDRSSTIQGHTYFIKEPETDFPIVSIGISPWLLFSPQRGLFMQGGNAVDSLWNKPGANFWSKREVSCNVEIYESDNTCVYNNMSGFRLFGGMSRLFPQKSIAIIARNRYGQKRIKHSLFGEEGPDKFKFFVLRNSGSDFGKTHFRDALMTGLLDGWNIDCQAYRPAQVYINGTYWGIYNIREKVNRFFINAHHDVDKDSLDLLEHRLTLKKGSKREYLKLLHFLEKSNLSDPGTFAFLNTKMDIDNFMEHQIAQIYFDNQDAGGNIKFWKEQTGGARWRWILYDTDWGFGLHQEDAYRHNSLAFHTEQYGPKWPNPPWSTFILRKLLENEDFERKFLNRFSDYLNTTFEPLRVLREIESYYHNLLPEMPRHLDRWNLDRKDWESEVNILRNFARERERYVRMHLMERFNTGRLNTLSASATKGGTVVINDNIEIREGEDFEGKYFENIPVSIKARPDYGYRFVGWEEMNRSEEVMDITMRLTEKSYRFKAVFERYTHPLVGKVMINEIGANNKRSEDWIELFNYSDKEVSLAGWVLTDLNRNEFTFPNVSLAPNDYIVICEDSVKFRKEFPMAYNIIGGLTFGVNKRREVLGLYSRLGANVDSVFYEVPPMDSVFTFNLLLPYLDNGDMENWEIRHGIGSPNAPNPYYVESSIRIQQAQWIQLGVAAGVFLLGILLLFLRQRGML